MACQNHRFVIDIKSKWVYSHIKLSSYFRYVLFQVITQFDMTANPPYSIRNCPKSEYPDSKNCSFCEIKFRNTLKINDMRNPFQYSHICKPLSVW